MFPRAEEIRARIEDAKQKNTRPDPLPQLLEDFRALVRCELKYMDESKLRIELWHDTEKCHNTILKATEIIANELRESGYKTQIEISWDSDMTTIVNLILQI